VADRARIFVTGMGMVSAAGDGVEAAWSALTAGRSCLSRIELFDPSGYNGVELGGEALHLPRTDQPRGLQLLQVAADEALADAGWGDAERGPRTAVVLGTCQGDIGDAELIHRTYDDRPQPWPTDDHRRRFAGYRPGRGTAWLADRVGADGPQSTVGMVCVSSSVAIIHALDLLRRGEADRVVCGGFEVFSQFVFTGFWCIGALASGALRPFDEERDGTVLGEGAVLLTLETEEAARARGARLRAEVLGGGYAADAFHMTAPDPDGGGLQRAVRQAMGEAGVGPADVDYVSAHGTGTRFNDAMEVKAFTALFGELGEAAPPISGAKAVFGHTLGAAGALDAAMAIRALETGLLPPTAEHRTGIAEFDFVPGAAKPAERLRVALSTNSAFGGNNSALLIGAAS
jgi:3-oxoacyl-[acyl-carrier-protein] synthase II